MPLRVLVVDDHAVVRQGLMRLLESAGAGWIVREAASGCDALDQLRREAADLAIVDLSMPGMGGIELLRRLRAEFTGIHVLVLSMHAEDQYAKRAFEAGAHGYIRKDCAPTELVAAVRRAAAGAAYVSPVAAERLVLDLARSPHALLSTRELEVLQRIVAGQSPAVIAEALQLSAKTVATHKARIMDKLQLGSVAALVRYGLEHGLDSLADTAGPGLPGAGQSGPR